MYRFRQKKTIIIVALCVMMCFMAVGYSILMSELKINGSANITSTWNIRITGITCSSYGSAYNIEAPTFTATTAKFRVAVLAPGDQVSCTVTIKNEGTLTGILNGISMTSSGSDAISYEISGLKEGDVIAAGDTKYLYVYSKYTTATDYDPDQRMKKLEVDLDWVQYTNQSITAKTYTIKYNSNGGSGSMSNTTCTVGSSCTLSTNTFTRTNYVFDGWALSPDGPAVYTSTYASGALATAGNTVNLYAVWSNGLSDVILANNSESYISSYTYYLDGAGNYFQTRNTYTSSVSFTSSTTYYFGTSFTFNKSTGVYSLSGTKKASTWSGMSSTYSTYPYTCKSTSSTGTCTTLYRMNSYSSTTKGNGYSYSSSAKGLYYTSSNTEDSKNTYFFRGSVTNNYVSFAGKTWRIVRINEDGSVRLILDGITDDFNVAYNAYADTIDLVTYNAEVGYMYGSRSALTYKDTHANENDSSLKEHLDSWYEYYLIDYSAYLADAGFCNDRSITDGLGYEQTSTYYGFWGRTNGPRFACPQKNDLFTVSSSKGNRALKYPIATLTADEAVYAGASTGYGYPEPYINITYPWWTMTPFAFSGSASVYFVSSGSSDLGDALVANDTSIYARPVINLKGDVVVSSGSGTSSSPYVIATS